MATRKTWVSIVLGLMALVLLLVVGLIGGVVYFARSHSHSEETPRDVALAEIEKVRARFGNQQPLIELTSGEEPVVHRTPNAPPHEIQALHIIGYDPDSGKLSHVDLPGWSIRLMAAGGRFRLANLGFLSNDDDNKLTLDDLERHGPGIILDVRRLRRGQALIWVE